MCQPGNQSIYHECRARILRELRMDHAPNKEMREVLARHGGCMLHAPQVDTTRSRVLVSSAKG